MPALTFAVLPAGAEEAAALVASPAGADEAALRPRFLGSASSGASSSSGALAAPACIGPAACALASTSARNHPLVRQQV